MVAMQWKKNAAGQVEAQWVENTPKKARHFHKTVQAAQKVRLRKTRHGE